MAGRLRPPGRGRARGAPLGGLAAEQVQHPVPVRPLHDPHGHRLLADAHTHAHRPLVQLRPILGPGRGVDRVRAAVFVLVAVAVLGLVRAGVQVVGHAVPVPIRGVRPAGAEAETEGHAHLGLPAQAAVGAHGQVQISEEPPPQAAPQEPSGAARGADGVVVHCLHLHQQPVPHPELQAEPGERHAAAALRGQGEAVAPAGHQGGRAQDQVPDEQGREVRDGKEVLRAERRGPGQGQAPPGEKRLLHRQVQLGRRLPAPGVQIAGVGQREAEVQIEGQAQARAEGGGAERPRAGVAQVVEPGGEGVDARRQGDGAGELQQALLAAPVDGQVREAVGQGRRRGDAPDEDGEHDLLGASAWHTNPIRVKYVSRPDLLKADHLRRGP